jgi:hypothetical protein
MHAEGTGVRVRIDHKTLGVYLAAGRGLGIAQYALHGHHGGLTSREVSVSLDCSVIGTWQPPMMMVGGLSDRDPGQARPRVGCFAARLVMLLGARCAAASSMRQSSQVRTPGGSRSRPRRRTRQGRSAIVPRTGRAWPIPRHGPLISPGGSSSPRSVSSSHGTARRWWCGSPQRI